jgi:cell division protein FtsA
MLARNCRFSHHPRRADSIQNTIRCVKELPLDVEDVVLRPSRRRRSSSASTEKSGAPVIDIGGGTTDYVLYVDGGECASSRSAYTSRTTSRWVWHSDDAGGEAKIEERIVLGNCLPGDGLLKDSGFAGKEVERETLNTIIHMRLRETFEPQARARRRAIPELSLRRYFLMVDAVCLTT